MSTTVTTPAAPPAAGRRPRRGLRSVTVQTPQERLLLGTAWGPRIVTWIVLLALAFLWLLPLAWAVNTSFKTEADAGALPLSWIPPNGFTLESYRDVLGAGNIQTWFLNSIVVAVMVTVLTMVISSLAAYAFSRTTFRGKSLLFALTVGSIMVPPQILVVPLFQQMVSWRLVDTYWGIALPQVIAPVMVFILKKFFDGIPIELEEAARIDGASRLRIFWSVVLPLSRPILAAVSIFVFINAWNNFLWPFIVTSEPELMTVPVGLPNVLSAYGEIYSQEMAAATLAGLPLIIVFMLFQRQIVQSVATTGLGGQ
ncbi:carbohydrate ABC transporter permease [Georgenia deserti]|uniref:Carbohydrate ABC transporter permease n=1 Tax=Georgenia deserti TaxID=2093781 RepID=A0ABW4L9G0_9MICO